MAGIKHQEVRIMEIQWMEDADAALERAKKLGNPLLIDFTAAPM